MRVYRHPERPDLLAGVTNFEIRAPSGGKPIVDYVGSNDSEDRYGSVIDPRGWEIDAYLKNPVVLWAHNYSMLPVGRALSVTRTATSLAFRVEFAVGNAFARDVYELVRDGFLRAVSVGFIPKESKPLKAETVPNGEGIRYVRQELLELSVVPVPANRGALMNAFAKGRLRESTVIMAGRSFRGYLNGHDLFTMKPPAREWSPSPETIAKLESYVRRKNAAEIAKRWR